MRLRVLRFLRAERERWFLWSVLWLMIGVGTYFTLDDEPAPYAGAAALAVSGLALAISWRFAWRVAVIPFFVMAVGFSAAQLRASNVATPLLSEELRNRVIEGTIDEIDPVEQKEKLVLSELRVEGLAAEDTPLRVRVSFRHQNALLHIGDRVRFTANLYPLPSPVMPGSYDFARHFYFRSIGGNGFAMRDAQLIESARQSGAAVWLNNLRQTIGRNMREGMPGAVGAVAAAMTVGETGPIPGEVRELLRDSGLAHMLSISGLHLSIVTGIVFYNVRLLLSLYPAMALRLPIKKITAVLALLAAFFYLMLSGVSVPAQRAFIMVSFLFLAILLDRKGITLRTLSISAMLILLVFPEAMFGASFQMSFAATLAIVALYERYGRALMRPASSLGMRAWLHLLGIIVTSLAATLATSSFVLYHFNRFAVFGLVANMVVVPLATFVIMPGMVLALMFMPFGLEHIGYWPLALGTELMIDMARWVTGLPYASLRFPSPTDGGLAVSAFGLMWLCLIGSRARLWGVAMIAAGLSTIAAHKNVDVLMSDDAKKVMVRLEDGRYTAIRGTARSFAMGNWLRSQGQETLVRLEDSGVVCEGGVCVYTHEGRVMVVVKKPDDDAAVLKACAMKADVMVAWRTLARETCVGAALLIDRAELEAHGAHALWLGKEGVTMTYARRNGAGHRVWQPVLQGMEEEGDL